MPSVSGRAPDKIEPVDHAPWSPAHGEAVDGQDAIEKARELEPELVLLDLAMPRTNGIAAASVLKDMMPGVRIVLFTMYSEAVNKAFASLDNVDAMVDKADGMGKLVDCVQNLLSLSH